MFKKWINYFKKKPTVDEIPIIEKVESIQEQPLSEEEPVAAVLLPEPVNPYLIKTEKVGYRCANIHISSGGFQKTTYSGRYIYTEETLLPVRQENPTVLEELSESPRLPLI